MTANKVNWPVGKSDCVDFNVYPIETSWKDAPGLYVYAFLKDEIWRPVYIGQCVSFKDRLIRHEREKEARHHGATHLHVRMVKDRAYRELWEAQAIKLYQPRLNVQLRSSAFSEKLGLSLE
jgi:excinuclease UvrABC nuclease subunit